MKYLFMIFLTSSVFAVGENEVPVVSESKEAIQAKRAEQYQLRYNTKVNDTCQLAVFINKDNSKYILKRFTPYSALTLNDVIANQDQVLSNDPKKQDLKSTLIGNTKDHLFHLDGRKLIIKYQLENEDKKTWSSEESILLENIDCANS